MIVAKVLPVQRARNGWVSKLVISWLGRLDCEFGHPLRGYGRRNDGLVWSKIPGVVIEKAFLFLRAYNGAVEVCRADRVPWARGHLHGGDLVGGHLAGVRAQVALVRAQLSEPTRILVNMLLMAEIELSLWVILSSYRADHVVRVLGVLHGTEGHLPPTTMTSLFFWRPHTKLLGHEGVSKDSTVLQVVPMPLVQHPLPPRGGGVGGHPGVHGLDGLCQGADVVVCKSQSFYLC